MVELTRWNPAREMVSLREAMDRLFEDSFLRPTGSGGPESPLTALPLDIYESDNRVVIKASAPGVKPEDIEITITGDLLTIKGETREDQKTDRGNYIRQERRFGSFCRQVSLPAGIKSDNVQASFERGILTLELPKAEAAKTKTVKVTVK